MADDNGVVRHQHHVLFVAENRDCTSRTITCIKHFGTLYTLLWVYLCIIQHDLLLLEDFRSSVVQLFQHCIPFGDQILLMTPCQIGLVEGLPTFRIRNER